MAAGTYSVRFLQAFTWNNSTVEMGGLSAILMDATGGRALVLGDRGDLFDIAILRDTDGINALEILQRTSLAADEDDIDSEGLALASDTDVYVSFEQVNQIARLNTQTGAQEAVTVPTSFADMAENRGLEALAIDNDGALALEGSGRTTQGHYGFRQ